MVGPFYSRCQCKLLYSVNEVLRDVSEQQPRGAAFISNLNEQAAEIILVTAFFSIPGHGRRKTCIGQGPTYKNSKDIDPRDKRDF